MPEKQKRFAEDLLNKYDIPVEIGAEAVASLLEIEK